MADYEYTLSTDKPDLTALVSAIRSSGTMTVTSIESTLWDSADSKLNLIFATDLPVDDKAALDVLVSNISSDAENKTRNIIMTEILTSSEPTVQLPRLLDALDKYPSFAIFLDNYNYMMADYRMQLALAMDDITLDDYALVSAALPDFS